MTNDLHDATLYYTVLGKSLAEEPDYERAEAGLSKATGVLRSKVGAASACVSPRPWRSPGTPCPIRRNRMEELLARARAADEDLARVREGAKHAGDSDPYRQDGVEGSSGGELDDERDAEDTVDRD